MTFRDLLAVTSIQFRERWGKSPTKTRLLKLAYLADLFHTRMFGERLLAEPWIYYLYGPYSHDYDDTLSVAPFQIEERELDDEKTPVLVSVQSAFTPPPMPLDIKNLIVRAVSDYGDLPLKDLLDFVYFETEPMINAQQRLEELDFGTVMPDSYYRVRKLVVDPKEEDRLRRAFRERLKKRPK